MKRRFGLLAAAAVLATVGIVAPSPASADTAECAGTGTATLDQDFGLPVLTSLTADFTFTLTAGGCVGTDGVLTPLTASGTVTGACGLSTGRGTANGHHFNFTSTGTVLVLTGPQAFGTVSAVEDPLDQGSCTNKTARNFLITGQVTLTHLVQP